MSAYMYVVVSGCRPYVTEPVDVVLVVTGRVLYVVGGPMMYVRCCGGGCAGGYHLCYC